MIAQVENFEGFNRVRKTHRNFCSMGPMSLNFLLSLQIHFTSTIVQYGPLNSFDSSMWKGLSNTELKDEFLRHCGLHISHWPRGENPFIDNGEEIGEEG